MNIKEAAVKWNKDISMVNYFCRTGRIPGAVKNTGWFIPDNAKLPKLKKRGRKEGWNKALSGGVKVSEPLDMGVVA